MTWFSWMNRFVKSRRRRLPSMKVVVFSRTDCHLCDVAWDLLAKDQARFGFQLQKIDVDQDLDLREKHGLSVPVVEVDGVVRFRGIVNPVLWQRLLDAALRGSTAEA